jgi:Domain of unknown function (DUF4340)
MTPKHFAALAAAATVCLVAAILVYSTSVPWTQATPQGVALFEALRRNTPEIARIEVEQGGNKLTLARKGQDWLLKEREDFPASPEKVRAFLVSMANANLVESKTRKKDRYALLKLEDPQGKNAASRLVRLVDDKGSTVAEAIIGKKRTDAFGSGKGGTYVRRPGEDQSWLVNTEIDAGVQLRDWVKLRLFETPSRDIKHMAVRMPGKEEVNIELSADGSEHQLQNIPEGMKVKYANSIDDIADAASSFDFDEVRKQAHSAAPDKVNTVVLNLKNGLTVTFTLERDAGAAWLSMEATGDGEAKKAAAALMARAKGWEFQIPATKVNAILKTRDELLEKASS